MTDAPPAGDHPRQRTPEEHAAVRRRALPVAIAALICGIGGIGLPLRTEVSAFHPPSLLAMNLACCAVLMGVGILFYARGTPGTRLAAIFCVASLFLGLAGSLFYTKQAVDNRLAREQRELASVRKIAEGARAYAAANDGAYPQDLLAMLEEKRIEPLDLQSPYTKPEELWWKFDEAAKEVRDKNLGRTDWLKMVDAKTSYFFIAPDVKNVPQELAKDVLVARSRNVVLGSRIALSFADGSVRLATKEEFADAANASNEARKKMGLPPMKYWEAQKEMNAN